MASLDPGVQGNEASDRLAATAPERLRRVYSVRVGCKKKVMLRRSGVKLTAEILANQVAGKLLENQTYFATPESTETSVL
jgi:hypothetical protein